LWAFALTYLGLAEATVLDLTPRLIEVLVNEKRNTNAR